MSSANFQVEGQDQTPQESLVSDSRQVIQDVLQHIENNETCGNIVDYATYKIDWWNSLILRFASSFNREEWLLELLQDARRLFIQLENDIQPNNHREQRSPISPYFQLNSLYNYCNCSANRSVVDSNRCAWSNGKHAIVLRVGWNPIRSDGRRPKGDDSRKRSFSYEARSAESKKRDKGWILPPRDSLDVDRSIPVTETEVEFCDLWSVPRECEINRF